MSLDELNELNENGFILRRIDFEPKNLIGPYMTQVINDSMESIRQKLIRDGSIRPAQLTNFLSDAFDNLNKHLAFFQEERFSKHRQTLLSIRNRYQELLDLLSRIDDSPFITHQKKQPQYVVLLAMKYISAINNALLFENKYSFKSSVLTRNGFFCSIKESMRNNP